MRTNKKNIIKHKYKEGQIVYCRPWIVSGTGFDVYKCIIKEAKFYLAGVPYYALQIIENDNDWVLNIRYEKEISKRPERLVKEAINKLEDSYRGYFKSYYKHKKKLNKIFRKK